MFVDFPQHFTRIAHCNHIVRQILCDDTSCANNHIVSDGDAGKNDDAGAQPAVLADVNRGVVLVALLS